MTQPTVLPEVILALPSKDAPRVVAVDAIIAGVDGNAYFPTAATALAAVKSAQTSYRTAVTNAQNHVSGAVKIRREARTALGKALDGLLLIVQGAVDKQVDLAETIATSAKMKLRKIPTHNKPNFAVDDGPGTGQAKCVAKAVLRALLYYFEYSLDQKSWTVADSSKSTVVISGLTVGQTYSFRFRTRTRTGTTDYSQILPLTVR